MKKLIAFLGLLCGSLVAIAALLLNPIGPVPIGGGMGSNTYAWSALEFHGAELDEVALLGLPLQTSGGQAFNADGVATANASILVLRGADGEAAALATRLVAMDETGELFKC